METRAKKSSRTMGLLDLLLVELGPLGESSMTLSPEAFVGFLVTHMDKCKRIVAKYGGEISFSVGNVLLAVWSPASPEMTHDPPTSLDAALALAQGFDRSDSPPMGPDATHPRVKIVLTSGECEYKIKNGTYVNIDGEPLRQVNRAPHIPTSGGILLFIDEGIKERHPSIRCKKVDNNMYQVKI